MKKILYYFEQICEIPHCSFEAERLRNFLIDFAKERGYQAQYDLAGNILIRKGHQPRLCLQAHYDMVCVGKAPVIETCIEEGWLKAKGSSLGADNGMAIAMMMAVMDEGREVDILLTSDEEVGLIGANKLELELGCEVMLNLDSEDEAEVCVGCAGGVDFAAEASFAKHIGNGNCYEVSVSGLPGGHSGVDIDKGIPNAISVLVSYLADKSVALAHISGGERINSIPTQARAIVYTDVPLPANDRVVITPLGHEQPPVLEGAHMLLLTLASFDSGVRNHNGTFDIPETSINLALIDTDDSGRVSIELSARAMSMEGLNHLTDETVEYFESHGFSVSKHSKYPAWAPKLNSFTEQVAQCMEDVFGHSRVMAVHAGLECGVLSEKFPEIEFASIGPTIKYPHSTREMVNMASVERTYEVLCKVIDRYTT